MVRRCNHYDAAFEEFLRAGYVPYVAIDEKRRALIDDASLKSFDFIVSAKEGPNLLVDVKGRKFPTAGQSKWENWATEDDIESLQHWQTVFGEGFRAWLIFAYQILDDQWETEFDTASVVRYREETYAFYGVSVDEFAAAMRVRSSRWGTVTLPRGVFRELRSPISDML
ncbi:HYExAFE family protein [Thalassoroseus pseudoceratinae]|uniref:HYExAFE family protein n=1 Tax=Thalassoroseus pseudoceratinae TaxID=2713176 RepID=UPI00141FA087|nr:HYExAFE family protein [Thalassoroseus pseudoceratinae]